MKSNNQRFQFLGSLDGAPIFLSGILSAALPLLGILSPLLFPFSLWTSAPLFYIGFSRGLKSCAFSSALALILTFALTFQEGALIFLIFHALPPLAITAFLTQKNRSKEMMTTFLVLGFTAYGAFIGCALSFLLDQSLEHIFPLIEDFAHQSGLNASYLMSWVSWVPGISCLGSIGITLLNCLFSQKFSLQRKHLQAPLFDINSLALPDALLIGLAFSGLGAFFLDGFLGMVGKTFVLMLSFPYLIFSFTTLHLAANLAKSKKHFVLLGVYALLFLLVWPLLIMVGSSIFEPWLRLRARLIEKIEG